MSCQAFISCASKVPEISSTASCHRSRGGQSRYPHPKRDRNAGCVKTHPAAMGLRGFAIASSMYSSKRRCCGPSARTKRLASPSQPRAGDVAPVRQLLRPRRVPQLLQLRQAPHDIEGPTPFEAICEVWTKEPDRFRLDPSQLTPGTTHLAPAAIHAGFSAYLNDILACATKRRQNCTRSIGV